MSIIVEQPNNHKGKKMIEFDVTSSGAIRKRVVGGTQPTSIGTKAFSRTVWEIETRGTLNNNGRPKYRSLEEFLKAQGYVVVVK